MIERHSENGSIKSQCLARLYQALTHQKIKISADIYRRQLQLLALPLRRRHHCCWVQAEEVVNEFVRVLSLDTEGGQRSAREVFLIEGDDDAGVSANGGSQDMTVINIGQRQPLNQFFVTGQTRVG